MTQESLLLAALASGLHQCSTVFVTQGGLMASLFLTGLVGSLSHCAGMCGPFVLSQVAARLESRPASQMREWHRLTGAALVPYHLGRAVTYAGLGAAGALVAGTLGQRRELRWLSAALLLAAALFLLSMALPRLKAWLGGGEGGRWGRLVSTMARPLFADPTGWRGGVLGLSLGFIPCGLLYGALAAASATGTPLAGALGMLCFTAGTVPMLVAVGLVGHLAGLRWRTMLFRHAPLLLVANAGILTYMAWKLVA